MNKSIATLLKTADQDYLSAVSCISNVNKESMALLDQEFPLCAGSHRDAKSYAAYYENLIVFLNDGRACGLKNPANFIKACGPGAEPEAVILENEQLHVELELDHQGKTRFMSLSE